MSLTPKQHALRWANRVLQTPYPTNRKNRGRYIVPPGKFYRYTDEVEPRKAAGAVYRPLHGLAYSTRVVANVRDAADICITQYPALSAHLNENTLMKLEIVAAFCAIGRENLAEPNDDFNSEYQQYAVKSAWEFVRYAQQLKNDDGSLFFTPEEVEFYTDILATPYNKTDERNLKNSAGDVSFADQKKSLAKKILAASQATASTHYKNAQETDVNSQIKSTQK